MNKLKSYVCDEHLISPREPEKVVLPIQKQRQGFDENDVVYSISEYKKLTNKPDPIFEGGSIISFKDPYDWETQASVALIQCKCGCRENISVAWLSKFPT